MLFTCDSSKCDCNFALDIYAMSFPYAESDWNKQARRESALSTTQLFFYFYNIVPVVLPVSV